MKRAILTRLGSLLSPAGRNARLLVMIYHRVLEQPDPMRPEEVDAESFQWQMSLIARHFNVLSLSEAWRLLGVGKLPARAACVTFDDGYADNLDVAIPILKSFGLAATFFVATGFLDGGRMWNDTVLELVRNSRGAHLDLSALGLGKRAIGSMSERYRSAMELIYELRHLEYDERQARVEALMELAGSELPDNLMLTKSGVRALVGEGMDVGAHTVTHPILARLDDKRARWEITESRKVLEEITGREVRLFAFPNGKPVEDYDHRHVAMVREAGFLAGVSTRWGVAGKESDLFQLPRFTPWQRSPFAFHSMLLRSYFW